MIVVLTNGRSGSSLVMQTLGCFGVPIAGDAFEPGREIEHFHGNPKGYFENHELLYGGPLSKAFQSVPRNGACKMVTSLLGAPNQMSAWAACQDRIDAIFVSFREPAVQAHSEFLVEYSKPTGAGPVAPAGLRDFIRITGFLKRYVLDHIRVAKVLNEELVALRDRVHLIDYAMTEDPASYVAFIAERAGLEPTRDQVTAATENIDSSLHRVRPDQITRNELQWAERLHAWDLYRLMTGLQNDRDWTYRVLDWATNQELGDSIGQVEHR